MLARPQVLDPTLSLLGVASDMVWMWDTSFGYGLDVFWMCRRPVCFSEIIFGGDGVALLVLPHVVCQCNCAVSTKKAGIGEEEVENVSWDTTSKRHTLFGGFEQK